MNAVKVSPKERTICGFKQLVPGKYVELVKDALIPCLRNGDIYLITNDSAGKLLAINLKTGTYRDASVDFSTYRVLEPGEAINIVMG